MVTVLSVAPFAFIVIVATRVVNKGFSDKVVKIIVPSPVASEVTDNQLWSEVALHVLFEVTIKLAVLPLAFDTDAVVPETDRVASPIA